MVVLYFYPSQVPIPIFYFGSIGRLPILQRGILPICDQPQYQPLSLMSWPNSSIGVAGFRREAQARFHGMNDCMHVSRRCDVDSMQHRQVSSEAMTSPRFVWINDRTGRNMRWLPISNGLLALRSQSLDNTSTVVEGCLPHV